MSLKDKGMENTGRRDQSWTGAGRPIQVSGGARRSGAGARVQALAIGPGCPRGSIVRSNDARRRAGTRGGVRSTQKPRYVPCCHPPATSLIVRQEESLCSPLFRSFRHGLNPEQGQVALSLSACLTDALCCQAAWRRALPRTLLFGALATCECVRQLACDARRSRATRRSACCQAELAKRPRCLLCWVLLRGALYSEESRAEGSRCSLCPFDFAHFLRAVARRRQGRRTQGARYVRFSADASLILLLPR